MIEFEWDEANVTHIARHGVSPFEVEELFSRPRTKAPAYFEKDELRERTHGSSAAGRFLTVIFTRRRQKLRPITAYDMNKKDQKEYGKKLDEEAIIQE